MRVLACVVVLGLLSITGVSPARAQTEQLSRYEKDALDRALLRRGLVLDEAPAGKTVGAIFVDNQPVFSPREGFLTAFNFFHITTKEPVIAREVLLRPGDKWDEDLVAESRRKITDPLYTTLAVIAPVKSADPSKVDLLVITRDIWSLRLNSQYEIQQSTLTQLSFSLSENNLFGYRKTAALAFSMDQGDYFIGPIYIDKNIRGTRLRFSANVGGLFAREDSAFEGTRSSVSLAYPLWSSRSKWAADVGFSHFVGKIRSFQGTRLRLVDLEATPDVPLSPSRPPPFIRPFENDRIPFLFDLANYNFTTGVTRSMGFPFILRFRAGYSLRVNRPTIADGFPGDDVQRQAFIDEVFPLSERSSAVFGRVSGFLNEFKVYRNVNTYDLPEDVRRGPSFSLQLSSSLKLIGSEENFYNGSGSVAYTELFGGDGLVRASIAASSRLTGGELANRAFSSSLRVASPIFSQLFRVVGEAALSTRFRDISNSFFSLGGDNGLRGFSINEFTGDRRVRANLEVRTVPIKILFGRAGALVFYDTGHAAQTFEELDLQHDVGFGLRGLVPQLQRTLFRLDVAVPLTGNNAGFRGIRLTSGIAQAF